MKNFKDFLIGAILASLIIFGCNGTINSEKKISNQSEIIIIEQIPLFEYGYSVSDQFSQISSKDIGIAMAIFYIEWVEEFGDNGEKLLHNLNNMTILWDSEMKEIKNCYDINGNFLAKANVTGLTHGEQLIWVWADDGTLSNTSLIHELVHVGLKSSSASSIGDADHEGTKYPGWTFKHTVFINKVNGMLRKNGI